MVHPDGGTTVPEGKWLGMKFVRRNCDANPTASQRRCDIKQSIDRMHNSFSPVRYVQLQQSV